MSMKNSIDTIGNRTRDIPACSAVPQPNAPPPTPKGIIKMYNFLLLPYSQYVHENFPPRNGQVVVFME
jgi:hypothetical protein